MRRLLAVVLIASSVARASGPAPAEEKPVALVLDSPIECRVAGQDVTLPAGMLLPKPAVEAVDAEMTRLQTENGELKAQNANLGESLAAQPHGVGLKGLAITLGVGLMLGIGTGFALHALASGK